MILKNPKTRLILAFFCLSISFMFAQKQEPKAHEEALSDLIKQLGWQNVFISADGTNLANISTSGSNIFIQQAGADNSVNILVSSENSAISVGQNGNYNSTELDLTAATVLENVIQNGSGNFFTEYANNPELNLERTINQNGDGHNVTIYGSNSITQKIRLNLQGSSKSVIIRNYN